MGLVRSDSWKEVKDQGLSKLKGETHIAGEQIVKLLEEQSIFLIPTGEVESFGRSASRDTKQKWLNEALERGSHKDDAPPQARSQGL